ncbi:hypothetical protein LZ31DRAFT_172085 [Colletotrichum somersetense]|nr:hypothetical protein LZ31DRAFT_172085 [Colletotrichum somersetense]
MSTLPSTSRYGSNTLKSVRAKVLPNVPTNAGVEPQGTLAGDRTGTYHPSAMIEALQHYANQTSPDDEDGLARSFDLYFPPLDSWIVFFETGTCKRLRNRAPRFDRIPFYCRRQRTA